MKEKGITLSPKHGVNPSLLRCICCGKDYGVAMLGKLKGDAEAPKELFQGLCDDCQGVVDKGGALFIEVKDGESGNERTGRIVGVSKEFKEGNNIENPISYMEQSTFSKVFGGVKFN